MPPDETEPKTQLEESDDVEPTSDQVEAFQRIGELIETPLESFGIEISCATATELFAHLQSWPLRAHQWAFRGHANASWRLAPSIERLKSAHPDHFRPDAEDYVRRTFKRRAHHYLPSPPKDEEELEWLVLMRHYGAPTLLLDWTTSPYVAAFFAAAEAKPDEYSAIWAIDITAIRSEAIQILLEAGIVNSSNSSGTDFSFSEPANFSTVFLRETKPAIVAPVQPFKTNERVTSQQGLFLCPNSLMWGFEFALKQVLAGDRERMKDYFARESELGDIDPPERLYKLVIAPATRHEILNELHRMNIHYGTFFPGLDGFARSLSTTLTISEGPFFGDEEVDYRI